MLPRSPYLINDLSRFGYEAEVSGTAHLNGLSRSDLESTGCRVRRRWRSSSEDGPSFAVIAITQTLKHDVVIIILRRGAEYIITDGCLRRVVF